MRVQTFVTIALILLCGYFGYRIAARSRQVFGVSPWRLPPIVWGILCAAVPLFGILLETVAQLTTRRPQPPVSPLQHRDPNPFGSSQAGSEVAPRVAPIDVTAAASGQSPSSEAQPGERRLPGPDGWRPAEAGQPSNGYPPLFGWYADPTSRHELRYWDGRHWTDSVTDEGVKTVDPL